MATDHFPQFANCVHATIQSMMENANLGHVSTAPDIYVVDIHGDRVYEEYLASFPAGTNPMFLKRSEHDDGVCKNLIRRMGNVVGFHPDTGALVTIWDDAAGAAYYPYNKVAERMRYFILGAPIVDLFRVGKSESEFGCQHTHSFEKETQRALTWDHFYSGPIRRELRVEQPDTVRGEYRTTVQVFKRGLEEITPDAVATVLDLINANNLYRGAEFKSGVEAFQKAQSEYRRRVGSTGERTAQDTFVWTNAKGPAARIRNTAIGTLLQDLSEGKTVQDAVTSFEAKVAPQNYKRTTALITPSMVKKAMETIAELGLESALERRFARIDDISVNDVLWVDSSVRSAMKGGLADSLLSHALATNATSAKVKADADAAEPISIDDFIARILPTTVGMEMMFKGEHVGNLVSLTAPVHPAPVGFGGPDSVGRLFRWNNDFAWSYSGNIADSSIKERVKAKGGRVEGAVLRISLGWFNYDDLDLHVHEPPGRGRNALGDHIYFRDKRGWTGGQLDVDMNAGEGKSRSAVENVAWTVKPVDGAYKVVVHNYTKRESIDVGFTIEVESAGKTQHFTYNKAVRDNMSVHVVTLHVKDGVVIKFEAGDPSVTSSAISQERWGLNTETYVKVNSVTYSPNFWKGAVRSVVEGDPGPAGAPSVLGVGNKHVFFFLDGAKSDEATRGIYNEFLHPRLEPHRKVFEIIGEKTKCAPVGGEHDNGGQLSGLGFSSTKKDEVLVRTTMMGTKRRLFNVKIG